MGESLDRGRLVPAESTEASISLERSDVPPKYCLGDGVPIEAGFSVNQVVEFFPQSSQDSVFCFPDCSRSHFQLCPNFVGAAALDLATPESLPRSRLKVALNRFQHFVNRCAQNILKLFFLHIIQLFGRPRHIQLVCGKVLVEQ